MCDETRLAWGQRDTPFEPSDVNTILFISRAKPDVIKIWADSIHGVVTWEFPLVVGSSEAIDLNAVPLTAKQLKQQETASKVQDTKYTPALNGVLRKLGYSKGEIADAMQQVDVEGMLLEDAISALLTYMMSR